MKKTFDILLVALGLSLCSCVNVIEDNFDSSASERLKARLIECQNLLTGAEYGWMIQYYPSSLNEGGYTYVAEFSIADGSVKLIGEDVLAKEIEERTGRTVPSVVTSHFSINSSTSVVLTFDDYNAYIHYWSDPDIHRNDLNGDFEFTYIEGNESQMVFRGLKTDNMVIFKALEKDMVSTMDEINSVYSDIRSNMEDPDNLFYAFENSAGDRLVYDWNYNRFTLNGDIVPFTYNAGGLDFCYPVELDGEAVRGLKWTGTAFETVGTEAIPARLYGMSSELRVDYDEFLGEYDFPFMNDRDFAEQENNPAKTPVIRTVTLERPNASAYPNEEPGKSFVLRGLNYPIIVDFEPITAELSIHYQLLGRNGDNLVYLCPWDTLNSKWYLSESSHIKLSHDKDFFSTGKLTFVIGRGTPDAFLLQQYSDSDTPEMRGAVDAYQMISTMTKK